MKSAGAQSVTDVAVLDLKIGHQNSSLCNDHQGDKPYFGYALKQTTQLTCVFSNIQEGNRELC